MFDILRTLLEKLDVRLLPPPIWILLFICPGICRLSRFRFVRMSIRGCLWLIVFLRGWHCGFDRCSAHSCCCRCLLAGEFLPFEPVTQKAYPVELRHISPCHLQWSRWDFTHSGKSFISPSKQLYCTCKVFLIFSPTYSPTISSPVMELWTIPKYTAVWWSASYVPAPPSRLLYSHVDPNYRTSRCLALVATRRRCRHRQSSVEDTRERRQGKSRTCCQMVRCFVVFIFHSLTGAYCVERLAVESLPNNETWCSFRL